MFGYSWRDNLWLLPDKLTGATDSVRFLAASLKILPPKEIEVAMERGQDARLLRAIGRAWDWRRRLERGDVTTIADLAREEGISDRYVSRVIRLAWLSPSVLERLVLRREPTVLSIFDLCGVAELPWVEQPGRVFDLY